MEPTYYSPTQLYQIKGQVCELLGVQVGLSTGNNQQVLAAVTGYKIRIMGWQIQSGTSTQGTFLFKEGSGGASLFPTFTAPPSASLPYQLPVIDSGYKSLADNTGLFVDVGTAGIAFFINYILIPV